MNGSLERYGDMFAELSRLQQGMAQMFNPGAGAGSLRALPRHTFPVINVGSSADAIEVLALAPGVEPDALQITVDKGLLVIAGERKDALPPTGQETVQGTGGPAVGGAAVYAQERFKGTFRRVVSLPEDADPGKIEASCRDGMLRITIARREASRQRQITVN